MDFNPLVISLVISLVTDRANITIVSTYEVSYWLSNGVFNLTLAHSKGQSQGHSNVYSEYFINSDRYDKYCQSIGSRLLAFDLCIYMTLAQSEVQSQGRANFDCEYLINGDR